MRSKRIDENSFNMGTGQKTFVIIFDTGDQVVAGLNSFAGEQQLAASHFTAIGAFKDAQLGYFNWEKKDYEKISIREQTEVLSLVGDITISEGKPNIHAHVVLGKRNGSAWGGHLIEADVRPTLEVVLTESPARMERRFNKDAGLALISLDQP
jgi:predicted DNA-binding protein with PD1-like motif